MADVRTGTKYWVGREPRHSMNTHRALKLAARFVPRPVVRRLKKAFVSPVDLEGLTPKGFQELRYWDRRRNSEWRLRNTWYQHFYTEQFGLELSFYAGKRMLDIGCGPRGSLEWASPAALRVGLDPLTERYVPLGIQRQAMRYVAAQGEHMPIANASVDVVTSFNSLDHVDELSYARDEIVRVLARGGAFLLLVDINHEPTDSEPLELPWTVVDEFAPPLELISRSDYEKVGGVYASARHGESYKHSIGSDRPGVLCAHFRKP